MLQLRNYQQQLVNDVKQQFKLHHKRVLAVLPCGAGKTVCFAYIARQHILKYNNGYVWFLVHRRELIEQTKRTFREFEINNDNILIDMVQTVTRHIEKYKKPTLIIFDEAHHSQATQWKRIIEHFNDVPIIGLTATPCRMDGKSLGDIDKTRVGNKSTSAVSSFKLNCTPYELFYLLVNDTSSSLNHLTSRKMVDIALAFNKTIDMLFPVGSASNARLNKNDFKLSDSLGV